MIKAIAFDLDGTLINGNKELSDNTKKIVKQLKKDYLVFITTGRSFSMAKRYYYELELDTPIANGNSSFIHNPTTDSFKQIVRSITLENTTTILNKLNGLYDAIMLESESQFAFTDVDPNISSYFDFVNGKKFAINDPIPFAPANIIIKIRDQNKKDEIQSVVDTFPDLRLHFWKEFPEYAEITRFDTDKLYGAIDILKHYNLSLDNLLFFGDGSNDKGLLKESGLSYAMLNAKDDVKSKATGVTLASNIDDGVYLTLLDLLNNKII